MVKSYQLNFSKYPEHIKRDMLFLFKKGVPLETTTGLDKGIEDETLRHVVAYDDQVRKNLTWPMELNTFYRRFVCVCLIDNLCDYLGKDSSNPKRKKQESRNR